MRAESRRVGCARGGADRESVPWVLSARVEAAPNSVWTLTGTVRARHEIPLSFRIGGEIQARLVDAGARVEAGDVLFRLDPRDVTQQRLAAEATVASARAEHENAERERAVSTIFSPSGSPASRTMIGP
jgi:multidrug efflux pump subunit AcrA (membrane-fusion protein)